MIVEDRLSKSENKYSKIDAMSFSTYGKKSCFNIDETIKQL